MRSFLSLALLALGAGLGQCGADARRHGSAAGGRLGFLRTHTHPLQGRHEQQRQQQRQRILAGRAGPWGGAARGGAAEAAAGAVGAAAGARRRDGRLQQLRMAATVEGEDRLSLGAPRYRPLSVGA